MFFLRGKYVLSHCMWNLVLVSIIGLSSPLEDSLYNIGTRLCSQRTTSSSFKCREKIRWRRLFINKGYEKKQKQKKQEIRLEFN